MSENQDFVFDKFIDDIVKREEASKRIDDNQSQNTPQREYIKRYRELPQNKTKWE